jgi:hypothetical protein
MEPGSSPLAADSCRAFHWQIIGFDGNPANTDHALVIFNGKVPDELMRQSPVARVLAPNHPDFLSQTADAQVLASLIERFVVRLRENDFRFTVLDEDTMIANIKTEDGTADRTTYISVPM